MARYIDADGLIEELQETICSKCNMYDGIKCKSCGIDDTLDFLENAQTADVVPKSEYDNLKMQFEALDRECDRLEKAESEKHDKFIEAKSEVAREIFEEIEPLLSANMSGEYIDESNEWFDYFDLHLAEDIAELKKKYTEGET